MEKQVLTYSNISSFKNCPREYHNRQNLHLVPRIQGAGRRDGTAFHKGLETHSIEAALATYNGIFPSDQEQQNELEIAKVTVKAMLEGYWAKYDAQDSQFETLSEVKWEVPIINPATGRPSRTFILKGKADKVQKTSGHTRLVEDKSAVKIDKGYVGRLPLDQQVTTYAYGLWRGKGIVLDKIAYRVTRKPSIKPRKDETLEAFLARLEEDYKTRADFYFYEEVLYRSKKDFAEFERELWAIAQNIKLAYKLNVWPRNTRSCTLYGSCVYMPLCRGDECDHLYKTEEPNPELQEESDDSTAS